MNFRIRSIKLLDFLIGGILIFSCRLIRPIKDKSGIDLNHLKPADKKLKILIIRPGGIGDAVLLIPSINTLRHRFPDSQIDILAEKRNYGIFETCDNVNKILLYDTNILSTLLDINRSKYDIVIDTEQWHKLTSVITHLSSAAIRVGYDTNKRSGMYSHPVNYRHDIHEIDSFFNLLKELLPKLKTPEANKNFIEISVVSDTQNIKQLEIYKSRYTRIVGLFAGATVKERRWGTENFARVAVKLIDDGLGVVLLGGKSDIPDSVKINRILGNRHVLDLTAKTTLRETTEIISGLDLFLSADSGLMHIASGLGIQTVSLFGAGIRPKWAPRGNHNLVIDKELPCSPCTKFGYTPKCPIKVKCLTEISVDEVYNACNELLKFRME